MYGVETMLKRAPRPTSSGGQRGVKITAITGTTADDSVLNNWVSGSDVIQTTAVWITWISDTDCFIAFYQQGGNSQTLSPTNGLFLPAGVYLDIWHIPKADDRVLVIQKTAGGNLYRWQSSL
jgi:hypothetical protein